MEDKERFDKGAALMLDRVASLRIRDGYPVATPETLPLRNDLAVWPGLELGVLRRRPFDKELG
jgi:hypothetical protein